MHKAHRASLILSATALAVAVLAGPTGAAGPAGISGYQLVTGGAENDSVLFHTKTVYCPTGKKPLGGGGFVNGVNGGGPWLVANGPTPDGNGGA